jgi:hypothetical protein
LDISKAIPTTKDKQTLQQELAKAQAVRGMAVTCLGNLCQQLLDPDVNADFLAMTDLINNAKLSLCNKTAQSGYNLNQNPALCEFSDAFDTALANLKESALTAEFRAVAGELDIRTPMQELFKACAVMKTVPAKEKLIEGMKAVKRSEVNAIAICKSLTHGTTPEATELIKVESKGVFSLSKIVFYLCLCLFVFSLVLVLVMDLLVCSFAVFVSVCVCVCLFVLLYSLSDC